MNEFSEWVSFLFAITGPVYSFHLTCKTTYAELLVVVVVVVVTKLTFGIINAVVVTTADPFLDS